MNRSNLVYILTPLLLIPALISKLSFADPGRSQIVMSAFQTPEESPTVRFCELIYREAFSRLNYDFSFKFVPIVRASMDANSGRTDGEPARRYEHGDKYPNLMR